ncbi:flagellar hook assembly protein FlgD [Spirochaeta isovalerica]|uniref:Basal-body rod modification protein FlgD n=1 Tax=Spirochaeta isovalerica TaxID=150 RepID=A0A841R9E7_9SPIO|nr:flagellar hook assembly protein FlgD [Spirochaeta isovalerica]MBB6481954.1 flagellar basal-body rod modification protein FlgD [Spirochaeta isovalerica]
MDFSTLMSSTDQSKVSMQVDAFNKTINEGRVKKDGLDKDDFLKILISQLSNQDPTKPLEDKEFIAQMAQFSSLEQMTNMSNEFTKVADRIQSSQALGMLGRTVEIAEGDNLISGKVEAVTGGDFPNILVDGRYFGLESVSRIRE